MPDEPGDQLKFSSVLLFGASVMLAVWAIATWLQQGKFDTALRKVFERDSSADVTVFWVGLMYLAGPFFSAVFAIAYAFLVVCKDVCFSLRAFDAGEDLVGILGPCERPGVLVPVIDECADGRGQLLD